MPQSKVLHDIERRIITSLRGRPGQTPRALGDSTGLSGDQIRRGMEWLKLKGLVAVSEESATVVSLGRNGKESLRRGLPERRLLDMLRDGPRKMPDLQAGLGPVLGSATGMAKRGGWIDILPSPAGPLVSLRGGRYPPGPLPGERTLARIGAGRGGIPPDGLDGDDLRALSGRPDFVVSRTVRTRQEVALTPAGRKIELPAGPQPGAGSGAIDVEADVTRLFVARTHPLQDTIDEIREIFVTLGFTEIAGTMAQSCFWNFDALFTPQDHPAREMQDTFYLGGPASSAGGIPATPAQVRGVSGSHSRNWGYAWDEAEARRAVLRTHTTCVTIRNLAENRPDEARIFSLGRVFRNEKVSYKHLVEFNQVEGVVTGSNATLRDLMGIQREFYRRVGITRIKFWPTFFPYTEPSLQTMVYNDGLGRWVELFGMGIFRPEVTRPLGITRPVLAWGGGIERIAMLKYGIDDVREFYNNGLGWLRGAA